MNGLRLAAAITGGVGLVLLTIAVFLFQKRLTLIRTWQPVTAQVAKATLQEEEGSESTRYFAVYELKYVVDGKPIRVNAQSDVFLSTPQAVQERLARHPPGTTGPIHVNPENPSDLRLNLGTNAVTFGLSLWLFLSAVSLVSIGTSLWMMGAPGDVW